ncbi:hypothetical protein EON80_33180 [bacterium]|nr:MAG: hypothetical protein EON80_33180 [bacterium]
MFFANHDSGAEVGPWQSSWIFNLNGTPFCGQFGCESAEAQSDKIVFESSHQNHQHFGPHKYCVYNAFGATKSAAGELLLTYELSECADGFAGTYTRTYAPLP